MICCRVCCVLLCSWVDLPHSSILPRPEDTAFRCARYEGSIRNLRTRVLDNLDKSAPDKLTL